MADLAALFTDLGLRNVRTVLASGNVLFDADANATELKARLEHALSDAFGYDAYVFVHPQSYLSAVADATRSTRTSTAGTRMPCSSQTTR